MHQYQHLKLSFDDTPVEKTPAKVIEPPAANNNLTYTGEPQELVTAGVAENGTMMYSTTYNAESEDKNAFSEGIPTGTDAGKYTVYYYAKGTDGAEDSEVGHVDVTIAKKKLVVEDKPTGATELTYTGSPLTLVTGGSAPEGGKLQYRLNSQSDWKDTVPQGTDADTYTVYYKAVPDGEKKDNYEESAVSEAISVTIAKAKLIFPAYKTVTVKWTGDSMTLADVHLDEISVEHGTLQWSNIQTNVTAGSKAYSAKLVPTDVKNYEGAEGQITVNATQDNELMPNITIDYTDEKLRGFGEGSYEIDRQSVSPNGSELDAANYMGKTISIVKKGNGVTLDSEPQTLTVPARPAAPDVKGEAPTTHAGNGKITGTTTAMEYREKTEGDNGAWQDCTATETAVAPGTYEVRTKAVTDGESAFASEAATVAVPAFTATTITGPVTIDGKAEFGQQLTANVTAVEPKGAISTLKYQWQRSGDDVYTDIDGATESSYKLTAADIGKTIKVVVTAGNADYTGSLSAETGLVAKAEISGITVTANPGITAYTGSEQTLVNVTGNEDSDTIEYKVEKKGDGEKYSVVGTDNKATNAGTYKVTVTVKRDGYNDFVSEDIEVTIKKATPEVTEPKAKADLKYTGDPQNLVERGSTTGGTMQYSLTGNGLDWSESIPQGTNAGTYTVHYKVVGDENYNDVAENSVQVEIDKAGSQVEVSPQPEDGVTYGGTLTLTAEVKRSETNGISLMADVDKVEFKAGETSLGTATVRYSDDPSNSQGTATHEIKINKTNYDAIEAADGKITAEYGGSVNLNGSNSSAIAVTLNKKTLNYTATATERAYEEGNTTVTVTLEPTDAESGDTVILTATGTIGSADAGENKDVEISNVQVTGDDAEYYEAAKQPTGAVTVDITKADSTVEPPTAAQGLVYTGAALKLLATKGTATGGELQYKVDEGEYSTAEPTAITAGEHIVFYKVFGDENHNGIEEAEIKVYIKKAASVFPTVEPIIVELEVNGIKTLNDISIPQPTDGGSLAWTHGTTTVSVGENNYDAVFTPEDTDNYNNAPGSITVNAIQREQGTYRVHGNIIGDKAGVTIKIGEHKAVIDGNEYTIYNVKPGIYKMIVTKGETKMTVFVNVVSNDVEQDITIPTHSSTLTTDEAYTGTAVDGLDDVAPNSDIVMNVEESIDKDAKDAITNNAVKTTNKDFIDVTITRDGTAIHDITTPVSIYIPFGKDIVEDSLKVYRYHEKSVGNGIVAEIPKWSGSEEEEYFEKIGKYVVIHANKFSTYALAYNLINDIAKKANITLDRVDDSYVYNIVLHPEETDKYIADYQSAELTFKMTLDDKPSSAYEVKAPEGGVLTHMGEGKYAISLHEPISEASKSITIGTVKILAYGKYVLTITGGKIYTDDQPKYSSEPGTGTLRTPNGVEGEKKIATSEVTIKIDFPNKVFRKPDNYTSMWVTIDGMMIEKPIVVNLGTTDSKGKPEITYKDSGPDADTADCSFTETLPNGLYTFIFEGLGYRTYKVSANITTNTNINVWNNIKDGSAEVVSGDSSKNTDITFLAGDILNDNKINIYDLSAVTSYFGQSGITGGEYVKFDLNRDGAIDSRDVATVLVSWGK